MKLGDRIRQLRDKHGLTQGQLAASSSVSQGYLSQLENGEVKNPSAAILLRVALAMRIDPDELFEAAGYPTARTLRRMYEDYESTVDSELYGYLANLPRDRQRRLLSHLDGIAQILSGGDSNANGASPTDNPSAGSTGPQRIPRRISRELTRSRH